MLLKSEKMKGLSSLVCKQEFSIKLMAIFYQHIDQDVHKIHLLCTLQSRLKYINVVLKVNTGIQMFKSADCLTFLLY